MELCFSLGQANDLNSNKAINAYFEDPTGSQIQVKARNAPRMPGLRTNRLIVIPQI